MRVLHVTPTFFADSSVLGGGERYARELAKAMAQQVETHLVSFARQPETRREGALTVHLLKRWWSIGGDLLNPLPWGLASILCQVDVIQCYQQRTLLTDWAIWLAHRMGKRLFVADMGGGARWALSYHVNLDRWVTGFLLLSKDCLDYFPSTGRPVHVVYGGVDPIRFCPNSVSYDPGRVLFVGRSIPAKGLEYLISAITPDVTLWVIGQALVPSHRRDLESLSQHKNVHFFSSVPDAKLVAAYQSSLVTVLPAVDRMEKLGLVLLESMACGTPVICSRIGGMPEIVQDGVTGFVVPPKDPQAIAEKIAWLRAHPDARRRMGRAGRSWVTEHFTWDRVVERHLAIYQTHWQGSKLQGTLDNAPSQTSLEKNEEA